MKLIAFLSLLSFCVASEGQTPKKKKTNFFDDIEKYQPGWNYVGENSQGSIFFVKSEVLSRDTYNNTFKIWIKYSIKSYPFNNKNYKNVEVKELMEMSCLDNTIRSMAFIVYSSTGNTIVNEPNPPDESSHNVIPDSIEESCLNAACKILKKQYDY